MTSLVWGLVAVELIGAGAYGVVGWWCLRVDERPSSCGDWLLWAALSLCWPINVARAVFEFFAEDSERCD